MVGGWVGECMTSFCFFFFRARGWGGWGACVGGWVIDVDTPRKEEGKGGGVLLLSVCTYSRRAC